MSPPPTAKFLTRWRLLCSALRVRLFRATGAVIGPGCRVAAGCDLALGHEPARRGRLDLGPDCDIAHHVVLLPYGGAIKIGRDVHLGPGVVIYGHGGVEIGDECLIAMHCRVLSSDHDIPPPDTPIRSRPDRLQPTRLGRDVWLGAGVTVLGGVSIGDGCVVGAGAVVTRDLPSGSIAMGVPARVVGSRTSAA